MVAVAAAVAWLCRLQSLQELSVDIDYYGTESDSEQLQ